MIDIQISSHTDVGDKKQTNQDSILVKTGIIENKTVGLYIVADGCGGLAFGEEISNLVVTHFSRIWKKELAEVLSKKRYEDKDIDNVLEKAIADINASAKNFGTQVESKVGSTLSLLLTIDKKYYIKNVGDSRIYLSRKGKLTQLTEDQSLVADMIRNGELTREEAKNFKKKNVLTMCIGVFEKIMTYTKIGKVKSGDSFLLCCDGLHNKVTEEDMCEIISDRAIAFEDKCEVMRHKIAQGEANDNVSSILCKYKMKNNKVPKLICFALVLAIVIGSTIIFKKEIYSIGMKIWGMIKNAF